MKRSGSGNVLHLGSPRAPGAVAVIIFLAVAVSLPIACTGEYSLSATPDTVPTTGALSPSAPTGAAPTPWPYLVVNSTISLAAIDAEFEKIGTDLSAAVDSGDLGRLLTVSNDVLGFLNANQKNIPPLQGYLETKVLGDRLAAAYGQMIAGIQGIHDSLVAGSGTGVTDGFVTFVAGNAAYAEIRRTLGDFAGRAVLMKRVLLK